jgi:hypothetical protein
MLNKTLSATFLALLLAHAVAQGDIYRYHDPDGRLIISNKPPPAGSQIESQYKSAAPGAAFRPPPVQLGPAPDAPRKLVDVRPLELGETRVEPTTAWWKKHLTGYIENRSGLTTAHGVAVQTACSVGARLVDTGTAELGDIGPRGRRSFAIPINIPGHHGYSRRHGDSRYRDYSSHSPVVSCSTGY